ncbi:uncharacterized protein LOC126619080 isoform X2 [Malus sylvestris]|uniref:uncharacterized protein LOC126619080 isoform X2 n=1 Tax=Malus sylvestris TaxID=3752 RepID=UPI0010AAAE42|nr:uncharacterized protein LOC103433980 isoform X2 [Malus domestica]XP_050143303.1 uncharacterized protein LOC126619080 isoform X2 [Malus sylvestris]
MAILLLSLSPHPPNPPQNPNPTTPKPTISLPTSTPASSKRNLILKTTSLFLISLTPQQYPVAHSSPQAPPPPPRPALSGISNTKNWFQFFGDGFAIRVPPQFQDVQEPEDYNSGLSLYGDKAKDITDLGSLKEAAKIFIPVGSTVYSARAIRIKEEEGFRTYYFYEFGVQEQHAALVAAVNGGKTYIAGATAPQSKWNDDGVKLRSAAISMTVL